MSRTIADMTADERREYQILKSIIDNDLSSKEEIAHATRKLEALEWAGRQGAVYERLDSFDQRLANIELIRGGGKGVATLKNIEDVTERIDSLQKRIDDFNQVVKDMAAKQTEQELKVREVIQDLNKAHVSLEANLKAYQALDGRVNEFMHKMGQKVKELEGSDDKILRALTDIVTEAKDEARTAIMAEAEAAAVEAVERYMSGGDQPTKKGGK